MFHVEQKGKSDEKRFRFLRKKAKIFVLD